MDNSNNRITISLGPLQIDLPQTLGYFGGIATAWHSASSNRRSQRSSPPSPS